MKTYSFKKQDRILKRSEFIKLKVFGKCVKNRYFIANYKGGSKGGTRLGITITKRVGNAVTRNKIKRITREVFRNKKNEIPVDMDINIIAKTSVSCIDSKKIQLSLNEIFDNLTRRLDH